MNYPLENLAERCKIDKMDTVLHCLGVLSQTTRSQTTRRSNTMVLEEITDASSLREYLDDFLEYVEYFLKFLEQIVPLCDRFPDNAQSVQLRVLAVNNTAPVKLILDHLRSIKNSF
jgi:hypothetical protein